MPTITLKDGDFGGDVPVTVDLTALYLPDPQHPGVMTPVPLTEVDEMEAQKDDHSGRLKEAARLGVRGVAIAGPVGLAAGLLAARKVKDVVFSVRLRDGRKFTALAGAEAYADLHAAQISARTGTEQGAGDVDSVIEKYLRSLADNVHTAALESPREAAPRAGPAPASRVEPPPPAPAPSRYRPVFGKRGS